MKTSIMKLRKFSILFSSLFILTACENEELESEWVNVTVIGAGVDCRENWEIEYKDPPSNSLNRFKEIGLPSEYKSEGLELNLRIREPLNEESLVCTTLGVSYPFKVILEAKRK